MAPSPAAGTSTAAEPAPPLVEVRDISKRFPADGHAVVHAVVNVSLQVDHGETLAVVGESGCGKSTLANLIVRLHESDTGAVLL